MRNENAMQFSSSAAGYLCSSCHASRLACGKCWVYCVKSSLFLFICGRMRSITPVSVYDVALCIYMKPSSASGDIKEIGHYCRGHYGLKCRKIRCLNRDRWMRSRIAPFSRLRNIWTLWASEIIAVAQSPSCIELCRRQCWWWWGFSKYPQRITERIFNNRMKCTRRWAEAKLRRR